MIFEPTPLQGAYLIRLQPIEDDRGFFVRTFCKKEFQGIGHDKEFVQMNQSYNKQKGTLRGMHYQSAPHEEIKLVRCIAGRVYDVIIDLRKESPTYLQHFGAELSEDNFCMLYVPEGFAHGFQTLSDHTSLVYHHTAFYAPGSESGLRYDDKQIGIHWPMTPTCLSEKDKQYPYLTENLNGIRNF
ncbi:dTDP-4-dehydrorhamnose 3,5-epimerase [Terrimonas pollutisoli]|uniref:dTDP-4-dehydrorhamnose 3,5-epimerase n=1 Tax=Terrimonas pollutisoli TaxID=3034147 RepID=UPI0023EAFF05|nr:dTDP-4-dehydrorhamnose 3,5-epimerase [Terrimonas sp. H1YJ31]